MGKIVDQAKQSKIDLGYEFPLNADGSCGHRTAFRSEANQLHIGCSIYNDRPAVCQIELGQPENVNRNEYFRLTSKACNTLQEQQGIDESYRVFVELE